MKRFITLFVVMVMVLYIAVVPALAEEIPTAKIVATLVGDSVPVAGEKFTIAISATEISSGLFVSGQVGIEYPVNVVTPVIYTKEEPTAVIASAQMIGDVSNRFSNVDYTGKFSVINSINPETGKGLIGVYIDISAIEQTATIVNNGTHNMFSLAFMLNAGYTYDDFYLTLIHEDSEFFLTADKKTVSSGSNGNITVEGIEKAEPAVNTNVAVQSGYVTEELAKETESNINLEALSKEIVSTFAAENGESDLNAEINILYNNEYHEAVLKTDNALNASLAITNYGTTDKTLVCYIAEYNADGCMLGFAANNTISVPAGETVENNVTKTFLNSNTVAAKVFLWEKNTLAPVGNDVILTSVANDYYGNIYTNANSVETNKQICGVINVNTDVDIVKFKAADTGMYALKFSADNRVVFGLYDSKQKLVNIAAVDGNSKMYSLHENETYYIKLTGNANNSYRIKPMSSESVIKNIGITEKLTDVYDCDLYEFVPEESGSYIITAVGTNGVKAALYNGDFEKIAFSETGDSNVSFRITHDMMTNEQYYIVVEQKTGETEELEYSLYIEEPFEIIAVQ